MTAKKIGHLRPIGINLIVNRNVSDPDQAYLKYRTELKKLNSVTFVQKCDEGLNGEVAELQVDTDLLADPDVHQLEAGLQQGTRAQHALKHNHYLGT